MRFLLPDLSSLLKIKPAYLLGWTILLIVMLTVSQDLLAAYLLGRGFFIAESLLFKVIWMFFFPIVFLLWYLAGKTPLKVGSGWKLVALILGMSALHLLLSGSVTAFLARHLLDLPFTFSGIENYLIAHHGPLILLVYGVLIPLIPVLRRRGNRKVTEASGALQYEEMLSVRQGKHIIRVRVSDICYVQSKSPYSYLLTNQGKYLARVSLKQLEKRTDPAILVRIHRSTMVNINQIQALRSRANGDYDCVLRGGKVLRWSRNYPTQLKKLLTLGY